MKAQFQQKLQKPIFFLALAVGVVGEAGDALGKECKCIRSASVTSIISSPLEEAREGDFCWYDCDG